MQKPVDNPRVIPFAARTMGGCAEKYFPKKGGRVHQLSRLSFPPSAFKKSTPEPYPMVAGFQHPKPHWKHPGVSALLQPQAIEITGDASSAARFPLRPVFGQMEPTVAKRCKPGAISRLPRIRQVFNVAEAVAAGLIIATALRMSIGSFKSSPSVRQLSAVDATQRTITSAGPITRFWRAVEVRSATRIVEDFHAGMAAWGKGDSTPAGWSHHPEGYVQPGDLALFRPSHSDSDYELEFLGQIERTSLSWVVRAVDRDNYYAGRLVVVEPGLRPYIAVEHYAVVHGKTSQYSKTPLSTMMHNNMPFRVTVKVKGNQVATLIEGEQIDAWADDRLLTGAVGFFSGAGERSRVYWMELSRNQDSLGRICARLSGTNNSMPNAPIASWLPMALPGLQPLTASNVLPVSTGISFDATQRTRTSNDGGGLF